LLASEESDKSGIIGKFVFSARPNVMRVKNHRTVSFITGWPFTAKLECG